MTGCAITTKSPKDRREPRIDANIRDSRRARGGARIRNGSEGFDSVGVKVAEAYTEHRSRSADSILHRATEGLSSVNIRRHCPNVTGGSRLNLGEVLEHELAVNTKKNYAVQWSLFVKWALEMGSTAFPADPIEVAVYLAERLEDRGHKPATLRAAAAAISYVHRTSNVEDPCTDPIVRKTLRSATRKAGSFQRQADALTMTALARIQKTACRPRKGRGGNLESASTARRKENQDLAIIHLMRDAMLRVSEAAAIRWKDLATERDGTGRVVIRRSKTDQEGGAVVLFVSVETMAALEAIREDACPDDPLFGLKSNQISNRIKRAAAAAGLGDGFSGHSPRIGMARDLARAGTELPRLMTAGRWRSPRMPALYIRNETAAKGAVAEFYRSTDTDNRTNCRVPNLDIGDRNQSESVSARDAEAGTVDEHSSTTKVHGTRHVHHEGLQAMVSCDIMTCQKGCFTPSESMTSKVKPCITATIFVLKPIFEMLLKLITGSAVEKMDPKCSRLSNQVENLISTSANMHL